VVIVLIITPCISFVRSYVAEQNTVCIFTGEWTGPDGCWRDVVEDVSVVWESCGNLANHRCRMGKWGQDWWDLRFLSIVAGSWRWRSHWSFRMSGTTYPLTWCYMWEDLLLRDMTCHRSSCSCVWPECLKHCDMTDTSPSSTSVKQSPRPIQSPWWCSQFVSPKFQKEQCTLHGVQPTRQHVIWTATVVVAWVCVCMSTCNNSRQTEQILMNLGATVPKFIIKFWFWYKFGNTNGQFTCISVWLLLAWMQGAAFSCRWTVWLSRA